MGYFDIQVNGYGGVDFNRDNLTAEELHKACLCLRKDGVDGILATIITEKIDVMAARLARIVELRKADPLAQETIQGLHIEGPFINGQDGYRGAHPLDSVRPAEEKLAAQLLEAGDGLVRIFTLAPEQDAGGKVTRFLTEQKVLVSAGHTNASLDDLKQGIDSGLGMFTHFGNGCPMLMHRHDNIIQRALFLRDHLWLCFIADGVHIPFPMLRNYLDLVKETGKYIVTTDAMSAAGLGPGTYRIGRWEALVGEDLSAWAPDKSHLLGSAMSMPKAVQNLSEVVGLNTMTIQQLTDTNPRRAVGL